MTSGARVVMAMVGGTLAIALIAVAAFLLTDEDQLLCVEGELQDNAAAPDGQFMPRTETSATIEEAEAFVCRRIPRPRDTGDLVLNKVSVTRTSNLGGLIEGTGGYSVYLVYLEEGGSAGFTYEVFAPEFLAPPQAGSGAPIRVQGEEGVVNTYPGGATITWTRDGNAFQADAGFSERFDLDALIAALESVR